MKSTLLILCLILFFHSGLKANGYENPQKKDSTQLANPAKADSALSENLPPVYITKNKLNVRMAADANSKSLGLLNMGETINVVKVEPKWLKIYYKETIGYVSSDFVSVIIKKRPVTSIRQLTMNQQFIIGGIAFGLITMLVVMVIKLIKPYRFKPITENDMLVNRTQLTGMVAAPGSNEKTIRTEKERNDLAYTYLDNAFNAWSVVKTEDNDEFRKPMSFKQVKNSIKWINEAIILGPSDKVLVARINELGTVINDNEKRLFQGSTRLLIFVGIIAAFSFYMLYGNNGFLKALAGSSIYLFCGILYYMSSMTPLWLAEKKKFTGSINKGFMDFANVLSDSDRVVVTKWSDGTTTRNTEIGGTIMSLVVMILVFVINVVLIPLRVLINFLRNYVFYV